MLHCCCCCCWLLIGIARPPRRIPARADCCCCGDDDGGGGGGECRYGGPGSQLVDVRFSRDLARVPRVRDAVCRRHRRRARDGVQGPPGAQSGEGEPWVLRDGGPDRGGEVRCYFLISVVSLFFALLLVLMLWFFGLGWAYSRAAVARRARPTGAVCRRHAALMAVPRGRSVLLRFITSRGQSIYRAGLGSGAQQVVCHSGPGLIGFAFPLPFSCVSAMGRRSGIVARAVSGSREPGCLGGWWCGAGGRVGLYAGGRLREAAWTRLGARRAYLADCVQPNVMDFTFGAVKEKEGVLTCAAGSGPRSRTWTRRGLG